MVPKRPRRINALQGILADDFRNRSHKVSPLCRSRKRPLKKPVQMCIVCFLEILYGMKIPQVSALSSHQHCSDTADRSIIRNFDYFPPEFPQGPPAFWISRYLVTVAVFGAEPMCKTSSRHYMQVTPGVSMEPAHRDLSVDHTLRL